MIKWFFLTFIALVLVAGNSVAFGSQMSIDAQIFSIISANLFVLSLLAMWLGAYSQRFSGASFLIIGYATLMLSAGIGFMGFGFHGLLIGNCGFLISGQAIPGIISKLATWATENNVCSLLSISFVMFGIFMSWPSLKLFYGITSRSR